MAACIHETLLVTKEREGGDADCEETTSSDSDHSESEIENEFVSVPKAFQRVDPGFLKRTYGVDLAYDSSLERNQKSAKLDDQLEGLRALLPNAATRCKERASIVLDAYQYITTLQRQVEDLNAELLDDASSPLMRDIDEQDEDQWSLLHHSGLHQQPTVEVMKRNGLLEVRIVCANRSGLLVDVMEAVETAGHTIMQARIACQNETVVKYLSLENEGAESVEGKEEEDRLKAILEHAICNREFVSE